MRNVKESDIERRILDYLNERGAFAFKIKDNTRSIGGRHTKPRPYEIRGVSDILAILRGCVYFIEVKTNNGVQSDFQKTFEDRIKTNGGNYCIARSVDDVKHIFEEEKGE